MVDAILRRSKMPVASTAAYTPFARVLHWLTAVLVLAMIPLGFIISNVQDLPGQDALYDLHRSIGVLLLPIAVVRLAYRLPSAAAAGGHYGCSALGCRIGALGRSMPC